MSIRERLDDRVREEGWIAGVSMTKRRYGHTTIKKRLFCLAAWGGLDTC